MTKSTQLATDEQILASYMQQHYRDSDLAALLAHAEDQKLTFYSCCCFIGIPTADHALQGITGTDELDLAPHYHLAKYGESVARYRKDSKKDALPGAHEAEQAFMRLAKDRDDDITRRAALIPLIRAEMKRRERSIVEREARLIESRAF